MTSSTAFAAPAAAYCDDRFRGQTLTSPEFFHGPPSNHVEDIPDDDGWRFDKWKKGGEDLYLVCNYGPGLAVTQRVQRGATVCLFPNSKGAPDVVCR